MDRSEIQNTFSDRILAERKELKLKGGEACRIIGIASPSGLANSLYNMEGKLKNSTLDSGVKIAIGYGISLDYLTGITNVKRRIDGAEPYIKTGKKNITVKNKSITLRNDADHGIYTHEYAIKNKLDSNNLVSIFASDNSMHPIINDLDELLIDQSQTTVNKRDLFAVLVNGEVWVRWIQVGLESQYTFSCEDKENYPTQTLSSEQLNALSIIGRVVRISRDR